jgi:O-antigen ligase
MVAIVLIRSRRRTDFTRFGTMSVIGVIALVGAIGVATQLDQVSDLLDQRANLDQGYDEGPDGRFGGQEKARALIVEHPFGIGTHTFRDTYHHEEPHNVYLSMFLNAGLLGGMLYIVSVVATLYLGFRNAFRNTRLQGPAIIAVASFAGLAFEGFVIDSDHWRHFFLMAALIWGIADAAPVLVDPRRRQGDVAT